MNDKDAEKLFIISIMRLLMVQYQDVDPTHNGNEFYFYFILYDVDLIVTQNDCCQFPNFGWQRNQKSQTVNTLNRP